METRDIWTITDRDILYEDEAMIAIEKPYGLPSQPTLDPKRDNAYAAVMRHCAQSGGYAALHHRLDALTSGILVLAKSKEANPSLSDQFQNHTIRKTYVALCAMPHSVCPKYRTPGASWIIDAPIGEAKPDEARSMAMAQDANVFDDWEKQETGEDARILRANCRV